MSFNIRFIISCIFCANFCLLQAKDIVLTTPKSGTHWFIYSLSYLTNRNGFGDERFSGLVDIDLTKPIISHVHGMSLNKDYASSSDRLIFLIRDFKECLPRWYHNNYDLILKDLSPNSQRGSTYINNLRIFDRWNSDKRLLIYYEDLCQKPREVLLKVLNFLEEDTSRLNNFMMNINKHREICIKFYNNTPCYGKATTKGEDFRFHQSRAPKKFIVDITNIFKREYSELSKKYLTRYF